MCILFLSSQDIQKDRVRKEVGYRDALHLKPFRGLKYESNVHLRIDWNDWICQHYIELYYVRLIVHVHTYK